MTKVILVAGKAFNGKDSFAGFLKKHLEERNKRVLIMHFADNLKFVCKSYFGWDGNKDETGRTILQHVGTDIVRKKNPDYWLNNVIEFIKLFEDEYDYFVLADTRFQNELGFEEGRKLWDVKSVYVTRRNFKSPLTIEQQNHRSETDLDNCNLDIYLFAEDLDELERVVVNNMPILM